MRLQQVSRRAVQRLSLELVPLVSVVAAAAVAVVLAETVQRLRVAAIANQLTL